MISRSQPNDFNDIYEIINDGASVYKGVIPEDRWHEPYMTKEELQLQIDQGVQFWNYVEYDKILGVMGIQFKKDVTLIRHAYVRTSERKKGIGGRLLKHLLSLTVTPVLIGTWAEAKWAINFYKKNGFREVPDEEEKNNLLVKYWTIPRRQKENSVVLASPDFLSKSDLRSNSYKKNINHDNPPGR